MNSLLDLVARVPHPKSPRAQRLLLLALTVVVLSVMMTTVVWDLIEPVIYTRGEIAKHTVRSPKDFLLEDTIATDQRRQEAALSVRRVFTLIDGAEVVPTVQLSALFAAIKDAAANPGTSDRFDVPKDSQTAIERQFGLELVQDEWNILTQPGNWPRLESAVEPLVTPILQKGIIANKEQLHEALEHGGAVMRRKSTGEDVELFSMSTVYDPLEAISATRLSFPSNGYGRGPLFDSTVRKLAVMTLQPNLVLDSAETDRRVGAAMQSVGPIFNRIQRGQVLVRAGDLVSPGQELRLRELRSERRTSELVRMSIGYLLLSSIIILTVHYFCTNFWPGFHPPLKDLGLVSLVLIGSFILIKLFSILSLSLSYSFTALDANTFILATPLAAGGILLQSTLGGPFVLFFTLCFAMLSGIFLEDLWLVLMLIVAGNMIGAAAVKRGSRRSAFILAGVRVAGINVVIVTCYLLLYPTVTGLEQVSRLLWAAFGGLASGILAGGFAPIAEFVGGYITDMKLLELASLDRPLLRELSLQCPGTWNHSMVLAQLGEAAAEAIGAHSLLTRVAAFYHDIGKARKPAYFVENQTAENRHDKLSPSMSALIIKSHVKDGIEMAEQHRLPQAIVDFIPQHHGTSLIEYFYIKALKEAEEGSELVDETHYRYAGPKPQTKEAGILMLADSIEAAARTLADPNPAKIRGLVQKIINKVFVSGELGESNLTLKDLHLIAKAFTRVLTGIYHRRIEYSEPAEKTRDAKVMKLPQKAAQDEFQQETHFAGQKRPGGRAAGETESGKRPQEAPAKKGSPSDSKDTLKRLGM